MPGIQRLLDIMARLRDPEDGCPWDLEQDFASISPYTIEEAYEVDDAIASGDADGIRDELGDLLFQVVFQARIAEEKGLFAFDDVVDAIADKLVRRHPHVFASARAPETSEAQLASWEEIKAAERAASGKGEGPPDPFEGIPRRLPALARSAKVAGRVAVTGVAAGADPAAARSRVEQGLAALEGETGTAARKALESETGTAARKALESETGTTARTALGEALRALVGLAREAGIDPEQALREADDREIARVRAAMQAAEARQGGKTASR